jgi:hypothetical protein
MSSQGFDEIEYRVGNLAPVLRTPLDSPYEISNELFAALRHVLHDVGGQPDVPQHYREKVEEQWEMNAYVTCECLGWRGIWNSEERRRAENDLGATLYSGLPYYARWATVRATENRLDRDVVAVSALADGLHPLPGPARRTRPGRAGRKRPARA